MPCRRPPGGGKHNETQWDQTGTSFRDLSKSSSLLLTMKPRETSIMALTTAHSFQSAVSWRNYVRLWIGKSM